MRIDAEYFKFKAEIWRNFGFAFCSGIGIYALDFLMHRKAFDYLLSISSVQFLVMMLVGVYFLQHSLQIMEDTYAKNTRNS
tara:strand:- start:267 stop:509 length:243 start_codon:yes stop_codon:yes gene_type:complete